MLPTLTLVIPTHKFVPSLEAHINDLLTHEENVIIKEILICHNGPNVEALSLLKGLSNKFNNVKVVHTPIAGLGAGCKLGIQESSSEVILITGSDFPFGFSDLKEWISLYRSHQMRDIVIGSKLHPKTLIEGRGLIRSISTFIFNLLKKIIIPVSLPHDTQGTIFIKSSFAKEHSHECFSEGFFFTTELVTRSIKSGATFTEVPVVYKSDEKSSSVSPIKEGIIFFKSLLKLRTIFYRKYQ